MILGDQAAGGDRITLDSLFRRAGVRHPQALALVDPPDRAHFAGGAPRQLSFADADGAISALAARLQRLGLSSDMVVAIQLANTVESVIALLGVLRAGMIAAPLPLLWREQEMMAALASVGAKAIVTQARLQSDMPADAAMQVAAQLFPIRHVCGFGPGLPDGVTPLDDLFRPGRGDVMQVPARSGNAAAHVAVITFDVGRNGFVVVARNHNELIAGGLATFLESGIAEDTTILSAIPLGSFAGVALTVLPWLLSGGMLALHHGFDAQAFAAQCATHDAGTAVLPGPALPALSQAGLLGGPIRKVLALWRAPERLAACDPWHGISALTDVASFGEIGLLPSRRGLDGLPAPIPCGAIAAPRGAEGATAFAETARSKSGKLTLRGPMVPQHGFPAGAEQPYAMDEAGFVNTGYACRRQRERNCFTVTGPPAGIASIGGYRFRQNALDWLVAEADIDATILALPDAMLGQCLAGGGPDPAAVAARLRMQGTNPLVAGAFSQRPPPQAA